MAFDTILIIGNGFDIDLGWNTRYSDFAQSEEWPFNQSYGLLFGLEGFLNEKRNTQNWFDLEEALKEYAQIRQEQEFYYDHDVITDKQTFEKLTTGLSDYLKKEEQKPIKTDSAAAKVLQELIHHAHSLKIYSFNYTNLKKIVGELGFNRDLNYEHVHGSLQDNSIILGIEDKTDLIPGYSFLYKTFNYRYSSHPIPYDLQEAKEIVFFGHSLGANDYHYFQSFFQRQCDERMNRSNAKKITIITYDQISRISIMEQLRNMNNKKTNQLFSLNNLQLICTKEDNDGKLQQFLHHLKHDLNRPSYAFI